ncbi:laminin subunit alpha-3 isoform X3 [Acanthopagrus latus]|uniref:laminin subunit alpha-3 isoform X3 n=1 Tax=Acanthopagrus latus TaxID=8177 RepID=UPI00187CC187|nr:laminin subunit alpha-3 isoform X3 [Acanthopagrus latus]
MQQNMSLLCSAVWLFLVYFARVCPSADKHSKCGHDRHNQFHHTQKTYGARKFCDPSFSNHTAGAVTQKCSSGFYREPTGPYRGQCVPCRCNGLSKECDEHTGNCVNCQSNTAGDNCERCKEGHYGNAASRTCRACPCPSTRNNFALACLDIGSGEVQCLCRRGYSGARCERCAFGYYGDPAVHGGSCKPCTCKDATVNICNSLTGECITSADSSGGDGCHDCDSCTLASLVDLEQMDGALARLEKQMQNITTGSGSLYRLSRLKANISETKIRVGSYSTAETHLDPKVDQLEADVDVVGDEFSQLIDKAVHAGSHLETVLQDVNGTKLNAEDLLSEAEDLLIATQDLIKRLTEVKPEQSAPLSENNKAGMTEEARRILQEMRETGCSAHRDDAGTEREQAHACEKVLDIIRNMAVPVETSTTADSLMESESFLRDVADLLSDAEDTVDRTQGLNLKSLTMLQQLEHLRSQLQRENNTRRPVTEMTKELLKNISDMFSMLEGNKKEFENHSAQLNGAKMQLIQKLNSMYQILSKLANVTKAEEHAGELSRVLHNATNSSDLLSALGMRAHNNILHTTEKAEMAANQSREAADQALQDAEDGLVYRAEGLKDNSTRSWTEANKTQSDLRSLSQTVNTHRDRVNKQKENGEKLRTDISAVSDNIKKIKRGDTEVLIDSAKTAASASNSSVSNVTDRLKNISQEVKKITLNNVNVNIDDILIDADQTVKNLSTALPALKDKIRRVEALSEKVPPSANMTETIRGIKDVIEETRNYVNRLSLATSFNGKGHVELHPPRNLQDIKAFTAVDLLLNRHQNNPHKAERRRRRQRNKHRDASAFVFYLGNKNASGDYIGMAIRSNALFCVYKLGGVVHEVETIQITTTSNVNSSDFDRVVFHRVYQDAEVKITQHFTTQEPVTRYLKHNLPNTATSILQLDPESLVFYVGGYPDDFEPPVELRHPKYRGAMKLSYVNDKPVGLFNYKRAVNMDAKQPPVTIRRSKLHSYYDGTGYSMAFIKELHKIKRQLKFHTNSRETNALLLYIGNEESFFCVLVERGFLVLHGRQAGRQLRLQSAERLSLVDTQFAVTIADKFILYYGRKKMFTDHKQTNYSSYYIGGLPAPLRQRHNITAPPLRGCVDHLTADFEIVEFSVMIGVSDGCPVSLLGVRSATLHSALSVDPLFAGSEQPLRISLGFRSTDRHGTLLRSSSQGFTSAPDLQLSLDDGYAVLNSDNYTLRSDKRYSDGSWHYMSAVMSSAGLELSIDNVKVTQARSSSSRTPRKKLKGGNFTCCIANLYTRSLRQSFIPVDLSLYSLAEDVDLGLCRLHPQPHTEVLPAHVQKRPKTQKPIQAPAGSQCKHQGAQHGEHQLSEQHSWLSYTVPQQDLNHRPHFSLNIKTKSSKGLILHVAGTGVIPLLAVYLANGKIRMSLGRDRIIQHKEKSNDGNWHRVEFSVEKSTFHLLVDGVRVTDGHLPNNEGSSLELRNPVYLGGDPVSRNTKGHNVPMDSVIGCVRDFKMNEEDIEGPKASSKTSPCSDQLTETGTYFGGGHIILDNYFSVDSQFVLAFEFRPQHLTGLFFHVRGHKTRLDVFLMETKVGVKVKDGNGAVSVSVTPRGNLCDGKFHVVTVSRQLAVVKLAVDSTSEQKAAPRTPTSHSPLDTLHIGGTAKTNRLSVSSPFVGCLRNVKLNGKPVSFETGSRRVGPVSFSKCPAY